MRAHHVLLLSLCLLAAAYAVLLFVSPAAAPIGVTLTVVGLVLCFLTTNDVIAFFVS